MAQIDLRDIQGLADILTLLDETDRNGQPIPFSITFVTFNRSKNSGGEIIHIPKALKCVGKRKGEVVFDKPRSEKKKTSRNPNHFKNATRNIYIPDSGQIRKVHIRLITEFNGQRVHY